MRKAILEGAFGSLNHFWGWWRRCNGLLDEHSWRGSLQLWGEMGVVLDKIHVKEEWLRICPALLNIILYLQIIQTLFHSLNAKAIFYQKKKSQSSLFVYAFAIWDYKYVRQK